MGLACLVPHSPLQGLLLLASGAVALLSRKDGGEADGLHLSWQGHLHQQHSENGGEIGHVLLLPRHLPFLLL